ncbi:branched-chain alpha-keto acid dehydrogenase subunit E2 [Streptomyces dioscori]|uniref:Dihydrolipoamide acetyltransferase component of pyruvate dehydrogenase complex n=1 Tax=Streptomyces dioscori TaxID=2109333 RepID=A0A2P8Q6B7_9ACTN|nr:dihydrolipoamide acetyltransferase family protein [Streptomyces dioscori]PSM41789.1 branched-chain alpha-keto acid dehydrogenase subunit E2 [Streptomyces dioscori]
MAQVLEFKLPDLGEGLTEAEIVRWLVQVGDVVAVDQPVVEVETAKAMVEVPCPYGGVVTARYGEEGTELPVGSPLLTVAVGAAASGTPGFGTADLGAPGRDAAALDAPVSGTRGAGDGDEGSGNVLVGYGTQAPPARRRRVRPPAPGAAPGHRSPGGSSAPDRTSADRSGMARLGPDRPGEDLSGADRPGADRTVADRTGTDRTRVDLSGDGASATTVRLSVREEQPPTVGVGVGVDAGPRPDGPVPVISPLVRRLARENGLDLRALAGSGPDGLITRADVEHAVRAGASVPYVPSVPSAGPAVARPEQGPAAAPVPATPHASGTAAPRAGTAAPRAGTRVPLKGIRGAVADKLSRSRREIPDATCWVDADATELMHARTAMNEAGGPKISLLALLARICTAALGRFPELNSTVDMEAREVVRLDEVHLGFAAQTERGLVVPVVKGAHSRDAESLSAEFARLTEAARTGTLTPADLTGGTFTLNNYGVFGVDGSTPIINHPEAAMLGVGRIVPKPWVHEGELAVRKVVQLSLTFDHRVCDGGTAGGFLRYVADCVEQPAVLLRTL